MIKIDNINVIVDDSEYSAKVEIPSQVTTSTSQEETVDLAKTPNLFIKVVDPDNTLKIGVNVEAQLTTDEGTYTMICDVVSKNQMYTTLQYAYGMTFEADDSSDDDSSDDLTGPQSLSEVKQLEDNTEFTFDGTVTVIAKSTNNRELYIQDADGTAGIQLYQNNIGSSFSTGDVIYSGWSGTKYTFQTIASVNNITNLNYSGDTTTLIAKEGSIYGFMSLQPQDIHNYVVFRNIHMTDQYDVIIDEDSHEMAMYNNFGATLPADTTLNYDAYGIVKLYNSNTQFLPMSFEPVGGGSSLHSINEAMINFCTVTIDPNPAAEGETVTVTVTPDQGNMFDSIEVCGSDTMTNITITDLGNNQYSFTMPAEDVDLSVNCISTGEGI